MKTITRAAFYTVNSVKMIIIAWIFKIAKNKKVPGFTKCKLK
jgi:hypothetical protein